MCWCTHFEVEIRFRFFHVILLPFRIVQDHTEGSSMQTQALETIQERLREAELSLRREQDSYRQMQVQSGWWYLLLLIVKETRCSHVNDQSLLLRASMLAGCPNWRLRGRRLQRRWLQQSGELQKRSSGLTISSSSWEVPKLQLNLLSRSYKTTSTKLHASYK